MEHFATKSHCPHCSFTRCWKIRRNHRKCKRCRREWSASLPLISGCRATRSQWRVFLQAFLWEKTGDRISLVTGIERHRVYRMALIVRRCMTLNRQHFFAGTVEIDETYIGGSKYNKRKKQRTGKRGHGTSKQPILGLYHRETKQVITVMLPNIKRPTINACIRKHVTADTCVMTDTFSIYGHIHQWYYHHTVNHMEGEYVRGDVHTNGIEGFWGCLKRKLKTTGGIRRERLWLYVGEFTWRYNHRHLALDEQVDTLLKLVAEL